MRESVTKLSDDDAFSLFLSARLGYVTDFLTNYFIYRTSHGARSVYITIRDSGNSAVTWQDDLLLPHDEALGLPSSVVQVSISREFFAPVHEQRNMVTFSNFYQGYPARRAQLVASRMAILPNLRSRLVPLALSMGCASLCINGNEALPMGAMDIATRVGAALGQPCEARRFNITMSVDQGDRSGEGALEGAVILPTHRSAMPCVAISQGSPCGLIQATQVLAASDVLFRALDVPLSRTGALVLTVATGTAVDGLASGGSVVTRVVREITRLLTPVTSSSSSPAPGTNSLSAVEQPPVVYPVASTMGMARPPPSDIEWTPEPPTLRPITATVSVSRQALAGAKVVGQFQNSFIIARITVQDDTGVGDRSLLIAVDQHAASERVRLGRLQQEIIQARPEWLATTRVDRVPPELASVVMQFGGCAASATWRRFVSHYGFEFAPSTGGWQLTRVPRAFGTTELDFPCVHAALAALLTGATFPPSFLSPLSTHACHTAIRIGTPLSHKECEELLAALAQCSVPWFCVHGRPAIVLFCEVSLLR